MRQSLIRLMPFFQNAPDIFVAECGVSQPLLVTGPVGEQFLENLSGGLIVAQGLLIEDRPSRAGACVRPGEVSDREAALVAVAGASRNNWSWIARLASAAWSASVNLLSS